ncbi:hypothetical protein NW767_15824 [Fusarium falciforme]|nr:hypothetical protein NW767_15824 [Fusarium falciforme]KAJ4248263.1 hypothetical protein NW757_14878 [Fusarium falciforme]
MTSQPRKNRRLQLFLRSCQPRPIPSTNRLHVPPLTVIIHHTDNCPSRLDCQPKFQQTNRRRSRPVEEKDDNVGRLLHVQLPPDLLLPAFIRKVLLPCRIPVVALWVEDCDCMLTQSLRERLAPVRFACSACRASEKDGCVFLVICCGPCWGHEDSGL